MESTACGDECPFVKNKTCSTCKECPNYLESWWTQQGDTNPKLIKDCAPKRMLLQQQYMQLRLEQLQAAVDTQRNENQILNANLKAMVDLSKSILLEHVNILSGGNKINLIENGASNEAPENLPQLSG
jgi:hypothetical protein